MVKMNICITTWWKWIPQNTTPVQYGPDDCIKTWLKPNAVATPATAVATAAGATAAAGSDGEQGTCQVQTACEVYTRFVRRD